MKNTYKPEGLNSKIDTKSKSFIKNNLSIIGEDIIYEGTVTKCDSTLNLWVDMCGIKVLIPNDEVMYLFPGELKKDIAIISRVGKNVCFKIIGIKKDAFGNEILIASRRLAQIECLQEYIKTLKPGDIIDAKVTHMEQFGAFCDIGCGIVALLSVDCISVSRISHPKDRFDNGDVIRVAVKGINEDGRIYLTHKELLGTWEENAAQFSCGQTVSGIIRSIESYGIFIELTPNLAGLAETKEDVYPSQNAAVYIKAIIPERMKIKLVLIDSTTDKTPRKPIKYIGDIHLHNHIDSWLYSPIHSSKKIETIF